MKEFDHEKMIAGFLVAATVLVAQGHGNRCHNRADIELYNKRNHSIYQCWPSSECHDGQELSVEPGSSHPEGTEISCQNCHRNFFSNNKTDKRCRKCTSCGNKEELFPCTSVRDRECTSRCISNEFYFNATDKQCYPCTECCEGDDINIEPQCITMRMGTVIGGKGQKHCGVSSKQCDELLKKNTSSACTSSDTCLCTCNCSLPSNFSIVEMEQLKKNLSSGSECGNNTYGKSIDSWHIVLIISVLILLTALFIMVWLASKKRRKSARCTCNNYSCLVLSESCIRYDCSHFRGSSPSAGQSCDVVERDRLIASCHERLKCIREETKLNELEYGVEDKITKMLDAKRPYTKNWWDVGRMFGIPLEDLESLKREDDREGGSPTRCLFGIFRTWPSVVSLKKFAEVIHNLERHDICDTICEWYQKETSTT